jgi:lysophospholipase L1-like esterase
MPVLNRVIGAGLNRGGRGALRLNSWTPKSLGSKLKLWLRGDTVSSTFAALASWASSEGAGLSFTQSSASLKPFPRYINGILAVDFDGSDDIMTGPTKTASGIWLQTPQDIRIAVMPDALSAGSGLTAPGVLCDNVTIDGINISSSAAYHTAYDVSVAAKTATSASAPTAGTAAIIVAQHNNASAISSQIVGGNAGTTSSGALLSGTGAHVLRLGFDSGGTHGFNGAICEIVACNAALTTFESTQLNAWLSRWTSTTRSARSVLCCGDSITVGYTDGGTVGIGGFRRLLKTGLPLSRSFVGPYSDSVGAHRGVSGEKAQTVAADLATFATELTTYPANIVVLAWGTNDLGNGRTVLQLQTDMDALVTQVKTSLPLATIVLPSVVAPTSGAYFANIANYTSYNAALPAWAAARGCTYVDVGAMSGSSDGTHPPDGRTGYESIGHALTGALLNVWG